MTKLISFILSFLFLVGSAHGSCNFESSKHLDELGSASHLDYIDVKIPDSHAWQKNAINALRDSGPAIKSKYKKYFSAKVKVGYSFGHCNFDAKVRINGDWKDHIQKKDDHSLIASLHVKLLEGNVLNAVKFKLLIPQTRGGVNEILATQIMHSLGFLVPETMFITATLNERRTEYIFQEHIQKELLERNQRREGPILEGSEKYLFDYQSFGAKQLEIISTSRVSNPKWAEKTKTNLFIALVAQTKLQKAYLDFINDPDRSGGILFRPNIGLSPSDLKASSFDSAMLAMNAQHGLHPHNRRFYFDASKQSFEPIYYDGLASFGSSIIWEKVRQQELIKLAGALDTAKINNQINHLRDDDEVELIKSRFRIRSAGSNNTEAFVETKIADVLFNLKRLKELATDRSSIPVVPLNSAVSQYAVAARKLGVIEKILVTHQIADEGWLAVILNPRSGKIKQEHLNFDDMLNLISRGDVGGRDAVNLSSTILEVSQINRKRFLSGEIISTEGVSVLIDEENKKITFWQTKESDWILLRGVTAEGWSLELIGVPPSQNAGAEFAINLFGLTGCLNIYDSNLDNTVLEAVGGFCEDSINFVRTRASIKSLVVSQAFSDAVDMDFSNISIDNVKIQSAGNDCVDVSGGEYFIRKAILEDCNDKAISVGERSLLNAQKIFVNSANIALATKDASASTVDHLVGRSVELCFAVYQKKQEFAGARATIFSAECDGERETGQNSALTVPMDSQ